MDTIYDIDIFTPLESSHHKHINYNIPYKSFKNNFLTGFIANPLRSRLLTGFMCGKRA